MFSNLSQATTKAPSLERAFAVLELTENIKPTEDSLAELVPLLAKSREPEDLARLLTVLYSLVTNITIAKNAELRSIILQIINISPPAYIKKLAVDCLLALRLNQFCHTKEAMVSQLAQHPENPDEIILLLTIVSNLGIKDNLALLAQYCQHQNYRVRRTACEILGKSGHKECLITLIEALYDEDKEVRESAIWGLDVFWVCMEKQSVPTLIEMLNQTSSPQVKSYILATLKRSGDKRAEGVLAQAS